MATPSASAVYLFVSNVFEKPFRKNLFEGLGACLFLFCFFKKCLSLLFPSHCPTLQASKSKKWRKNHNNRSISINKPFVWQQNKHKDHQTPYQSSKKNNDKNTLKHSHTHKKKKTVYPPQAPDRLGAPSSSPEAARPALLKTRHFRKILLETGILWKNLMKWIIF